MISMEDWITIRNLKNRNPKLGSRKIAELWGISHNTVNSRSALYRHIETELKSQRESRNTKTYQPKEN